MSSDREAWVAIENDFPDHPKVVQVGAAGGWAHLCAICYADRFRTNGFIPERIAQRIFTQDSWMDEAAHDGLLHRLLEAHLWEEVEGGYLIHDYLKHQRNADEIKSLREVRAAAGRLGGLASAEARRSKSQAKRSNPQAETEVEVETEKRTLAAADPPRQHEQEHKNPRPRDELWDALAETLGQPTTKSERGRRNKAVKELREIGATATEIRNAARRYKIEWPDIALTDTALVANWSRFKNGGPGETSAERFQRRIEERNRQLAAEEAEWR